MNGHLNVKFLNIFVNSPTNTKKCTVCSNYVSLYFHTQPIRTSLSFKIFEWTELLIYLIIQSCFMFA